MRARVGYALAFLLCICLGSCIGATRLPERTRGPQGETKKIDLSFLKAGETSRAEVRDKLKLIDAGVVSNHFFVGRWDTSRWGAWAVLAGYGGAMGNAGRIWRDANLLVEFDDNGIVKRFETFPDKLFADKLNPVVRESAFSGNERLDVEVSFDTRLYRPATVILSAGSLEFIENRKVKKPFHFQVPRQWLVGAKPFVYPDSDPAHVGTALHFFLNLKNAQGPHTRSVNVQSNIPQLITLLRYSLKPAGTTPTPEPHRN